VAALALWALTIAPAFAGETAAVTEPPLIAYSLELSAAHDFRDANERDRALRAATYTLEHNPPPPNEACSKTLGARRFAAQYRAVAGLRMTRGEFDESMRTYQAALACTPRDASLHSDIAWLHVTMGQLDAARAMLDRGLAIDPDNHELTTVQPRIDFLQERWADATARFRLAIVVDAAPRSDLVDYYETFYWLSQRRAGVRVPELAPLPEHTDKPEPPDNDGSEWPAPILDALKGDKTEAQVVEAIRDERWEHARRQWLTEALFYVGELRLAEGDVETARKHFAAVVNLKVTDFVEYAMARAELAKLRERAAR
jgi:tetratricopeptide (TPR) repeat protein